MRLTGVYFLQLSDFEKLGRAFVQVCQEITGKLATDEVRQ